MNTSLTISILGLLVLAALGFKGLDVSGAVVTLVGAYVASEASKRASHVWASSKDPNCDTIQAIKSVEGKSGE